MSTSVALVILSFANLPPYYHHLPVHSIISPFCNWRPYIIFNDIMLSNEPNIANYIINQVIPQVDQVCLCSGCYYITYVTAVICTLLRMSLLYYLCFV